MRTRRLVAAAAATTLLVSPPAAGASGLPGSGREGKTTVVATAYPLYEAAATIGGDRVHATNLLPLGAFDRAPLTPRQAERLRVADIVLIVGKGTQPEVEAIASRRTGPTVRILDTLDPGSPTTLDRHVWLDTSQMAEITSHVYRSLHRFDPAGGPKFRKRLRSYERSIAAVDRNYGRGLAQCERRSFVVAEPEFGFMARRYNLVQAPLDLSTVTLPSDRAKVEAIADATKRADPGSSAVFLPRLPPVDDARLLLRRHGIKAAVLDPIADQTDQARRGGAGYAVVMGLNLEALRSGLRCTDAPDGK